ncbi:MAG: cation diffusion facilitator family transporter [Lachnospiraceae bacterium]
MSKKTKENIEALRSGSEDFKRPEGAVPAADLAKSRENIIVKTSIIGILANLLLAGFKAAVGALSGSIAIILDAVNNLSDALSSVITIIGTKLAARQPDKKHPFGYRRIEYIATLLISVIILYAGLTALVESVKKIIEPEVPDYSVLTLVVVGSAILVKLLLGSYVKRTGKKVNSDSLIASGTDALMDSIISTATFVAAIIFMLTHVSLEAYLAAVISIVILKSGFEMLMDTMNNILGQRPDPELSKSIRAAVRSVPGVLGAYDLLIHNYGPDYSLGSIHIEVGEETTAHRIDELTRQIQKKVYEECGFILTTVGIYSRNIGGGQAAQMRTELSRIALSHEYVQQVHGVFIDFEDGRITFDVVVSFDAPDRNAVYRHVWREVAARYPDYEVYATLDADTAD